MTTTFLARVSNSHIAVPDAPEQKVERGPADIPTSLPGSRDGGNEGGVLANVLALEAPRYGHPSARDRLASILAGPPIRDR